MEDLTEDQQEEIRDVFAVIDTNKNDSIDVSELGKGLRALGLNPSNAEVNDFMHQYDKDNNSVLTLEEFAELYIKIKEESKTTQEEIEEQFKKLDVNGDGKIDAEELKKVLMHGDEKLTDEEIQEIIAEFDTNGDGKISLQEFVNGVLGKSS